MTRGKKVEVFTFDINGLKIEIDVKICRGETTSEPKSAFVISDSDYHLSLQNTDIEALRAEAKKELEATLSIKWERFLYITFKGTTEITRDRPSSKVVLSAADDPPQVEKETGTIRRREQKYERQLPNGGADSEFDFRLIEIGTTNGGTKCWRHVEEWGEGHTQEGLPHTGKGGEHRNEDELKVLLPATRPNYEVLEKMRLAFDELSKQLYKFLKPENIEKAVAAMAMKELPVPDIFEGMKEEAPAKDSKLERREQARHG